MEHQLLKILEQIRANVPGNIFTGVGVVLCNSLEYLPFLEIGRDSKITSEIDAISAIIEGSLATNANHDGFNILSEDFSLLYRNVFISPPITSDIKLDNKQGGGARYVAAMLTSKVEGIVLTAVISNSYGIVIFKDGKIVNSND